MEKYLREYHRCNPTTGVHVETYYDVTSLKPAQGLRASSLQFTSPLEFNAIFRYGFPLRVDLNG